MRHGSDATTDEPRRRTLACASTGGSSSACGEPASVAGELSPPNVAAAPSGDDESSTKSKWRRGSSQSGSLRLACALSPPNETHSIGDGWTQEIVRRHQELNGALSVGFLRRPLLYGKAAFPPITCALACDSKRRSESCHKDSRNSDITCANICFARKKNISKSLNTG